jgi:hypothetical protein
MVIYNTYVPVTELSVLWRSSHVVLTGTFVFSEVGGKWMAVQPGLQPRAAELRIYILNKYHSSQGFYKQQGFLFWAVVGLNSRPRACSTT